MIRWIAIAGLLALGLAACGSPDDLGASVPPRARLAAPLNAPVGVPILFDASTSFATDGAIREYTFSFSDGSQPVTVSTPSITHVFADAGAYEVALIVKDDLGAMSRATQLVLVRPDAPTCQATSDCSLGADCRGQLCYVVGSGPGTGVADCKDDSDCGPESKCRGGLCLGVSGPSN